MKILRTSSLGSNFTGSYQKKSVCQSANASEILKKLIKIQSLGK